VAGTVFDDINGNAVRDDFEAGVSDVRISAFEVTTAGAAGNLVAASTSNNQGRYEVLGLRVNQPYILIAQLPGGKVVTGGGTVGVYVDQSGASRAFSVAETAGLDRFNFGIRNEQPVVHPTTVVQVLGERMVVVVTPTPDPAADAPPLALTGTNSAPMVVVGLVLLAAGVSLMAARRRKVSRLSR